MGEQESLDHLWQSQVSSTVRRTIATDLHASCHTAKLMARSGSQHQERGNIEFRMPTGVFLGQSTCGGVRQESPMAGSGVAVLLQIKA